MSRGTGRTLTLERRRELIAQWEEQALALDLQARSAREDGDPLYAYELEQSAVDYRDAAFAESLFVTVAERAASDGC